MKKMNHLILLALAAITVTSCSTTNNTMDGGVGGRRYTKGFHVTHAGKAASETTLAADDQKSNEIRSEVVTEEVVVTEETSTRTSENVANTTVSTHREKAVIANSKAVEVKRGHRSPANNTVTSEEKKPATVLKKNKSVKDILGKKQSSGGSSDGGMFILAVIFAILIPPIGVLIYTNIDWMKVLIALLLTILFFLPGMIYALLVVFDVI